MNISKFCKIIFIVRFLQSYSLTVFNFFALIKFDGILMLPLGLKCYKSKTINRINNSVLGSGFVEIVIRVEGLVWDKTRILDRSVPLVGRNVGIDAELRCNMLFGSDDSQRPDAAGVMLRLAGILQPHVIWLPCLPRLLMPSSCLYRYWKFI